MLSIDLVSTILVGFVLPVSNAFLQAIYSGQSLSAPSTLTTRLGNIHGDRFQIQSDGNVVLYFYDGSFQAQWASNTQNVGFSPYTLELGFDNNLVAHDVNDTLIWESETDFGIPGNATLILQNTGNVELYDINGTLLWQTATFDTNEPTTIPSTQPTGLPTSTPSKQPSNQPSIEPSSQPSVLPTSDPSKNPTTQPSSIPSIVPTDFPSGQPSLVPSSAPSAIMSTTEDSGGGGNNDNSNSKGFYFS